MLVLGCRVEEGEIILRSLDFLRAYKFARDDHAHPSRSAGDSGTSFGLESSHSLSPPPRFVHGTARRKRNMQFYHFPDRLDLP